MDGCWQFNESLHHVEVVINMTAKKEKGVYFPSVRGDVLENHEKYEDFNSAYGIYKIPVPISEHHLSPQDAVVLHNPNGYDYQDDVFGLILEVHDDGIIVEVYGYMGYEEFYSVELIG